MMAMITRPDDVRFRGVGGYALRRRQGPDRHRSGKIVAVLLLVVFFFTTAVSAAEVTLSTPRSEYYVPTGEEAVIPLTIVSTYDHDITGTLKQSIVLVNPGS